MQQAHEMATKNAQLAILPTFSKDTKELSG
jgi:hypothetical protein